MVEMVEFFPWIWREINTQVARKACRDMLIYIYLCTYTLYEYDTALSTLILCQARDRVHSSGSKLGQSLFQVILVSCVRLCVYFCNY